jgi:hypothetical protein
MPSAQALILTFIIIERFIIPLLFPEKAMKVKSEGDIK